MEVNSSVAKKISDNLDTTSLITIKSTPLSISPQKMKVIAELVRYQDLDYLLKFLPFLPSKGGKVILELFQNEIKHWEKKGLVPSDFYVHKIQTNQGRTRKKVFFRAKGRADRIRSRRSLIEISLSKKTLKGSKVNPK